MTNLKRLFLSCNELSTLPAGFELGWTQLNTLRILACPPRLFSLIDIDLAFNNFTHLPAEIVQLTALKNLGMRGVRSVQIIYVPIDISGNGIVPKRPPKSLEHLLVLLRDGIYNSLIDFYIFYD